MPLSARRNKKIGNTYADMYAEPNLQMYTCRNIQMVKYGLCRSTQGLHKWGRCAVSPAG